MQTITVNKSIDCTGLSCPMPVVRTKKAMDELQPGEVLEVLATDPGSVSDVKSWANRTGHQFIGTCKEGDVFKHYIRKADPAEVRPEQRYGQVVSNEELKAKLPEGPVILDVREPAEYAFGHIPGAISVPLGELEGRVTDLQAFVDKDVYVVCRTGHRSDIACQILAEHGFRNVKNVIPGMSEWTEPLEQEI
jgi:rhodanese-related sulfurtransferase/TusA-related sulfurtransferase